MKPTAAPLSMLAVLSATARAASPLPRTLNRFSSRKIEGIMR